MANIGMYLLLLKLLFWCEIIQTVSTDGHVNIQIEVLQYDNPLGTSYHGSDVTLSRKCCDSGTVPACSGTDFCDSYFILCIGGLNSRGKCNGPGATTAVISNKNSFSTSYDNTIIHSFKWDHWKSGAIEYIANVMDKDGSSKDLIDNFTLTVTLRADSHYDNSTPQVMSFKNFVSLDLGIRIWCQDGYTGSDCSHSCTSKPYSVCTQNHGATLLPSCSSSDVSSIKFSLNQVPVNYTPSILHTTASHEICSARNMFRCTQNRCQNSTFFSCRAKVIMMIRSVSYHDATQSCGQHGCNVRISVCLKANNHGLDCLEY